MGRMATKFTEKIQITPLAALKYYGRSVAEIMDRKAQSSNRDYHFLTETDLKWMIGYVRGPDSDEIEDVEAYTQHLAKGTIVKLTGQSSNGKWWHESDINEIPPQVMAKLESHARRVANRNAQEPEEEDTDYIVEQKPDDSPIKALEAWLNQHPHADKKLSSIALLVLEKLME
jgi:hypothetical protein